MPNPLTIFFCRSPVTYPLFVQIICSFPSRWVSLKLNPIKASIRLIVFLQQRSAPFLVKVGLGCYWTTSNRSPADAYGTQFPYPQRVMISPEGMPICIFTGKSTSFFVILRPSHTLHLAPSSNNSPKPLQLSQFFYI